MQSQLSKWKSYVKFNILCYVICSTSYINITNTLLMKAYNTYFVRYMSIHIGWTLSTILYHYWDNKSLHLYKRGYSIMLAEWSGFAPPPLSEFFFVLKNPTKKSFFYSLHHKTKLLTNLHTTILIDSVVPRRLKRYILENLV